MEQESFAIPEMLSLIYEEMDVDVIEERFVNLVGDIFAFDRVGLFFVKHRKKVLKGKLCKGFNPGSISALEIPISDEFILTKPLLTGFPCLESGLTADPFLRELGLNNFALIPVVNNKRVACWDIKKCGMPDCPAYGKKWLRCWLAPGTKCCPEIENGGGDESALRQKACGQCPVFSKYDARATEGVLLVDNSLSGRPIDKETVLLLSIVAHAVGMAINNSKAYSSVLQEAIRDELTGLHNRRYFNERLVDEVERTRRYGGQFSLLFVDIDLFKLVNDKHGHHIGDVVLASLGDLFLALLRQSDVVSRYGGEEFAILLADTSKEKAAVIAEKLRVAVASAGAENKLPVPVTVSLGVAAYGRDANFMEGLLEKADKALYCAKALGRNRVCLA